MCVCVSLLVNMARRLMGVSLNNSVYKIIYQGCFQEKRTCVSWAQCSVQLDSEIKIPVMVRIIV